MRLVQLWMYGGAAKRGATMVYFWNGPPYWMTLSGCSSGSVNGSSDSLPSGSESRFAKHIVDVLALFRDTYALRADFVRPINEPEANWWRAGEAGGQEGCHTSADQTVVIFRELRRELDRREMRDVGIRDDTLRSVCFLHSTTKQFVIVTVGDTIADRTPRYDLSALVNARAISRIRSGPEGTRRPIAHTITEKRPAYNLPALCVVALTSSCKPIRLLRDGRPSRPR